MTHGPRARNRNRARAQWLLLTAALALVLALPGSGIAQPARNVVSDVRVDANGLGRSIRIKTERKPTFTVFRLNDPMRVVIDISHGDVSGATSPMVVEDGVIGQIALRQFSAGKQHIARILIGLEADEVPYEVRAADDGVNVLVGPPAIVDTSTRTSSALGRLVESARATWFEGSETRATTPESGLEPPDLAAAAEPASFGEREEPPHSATIDDGHDGDGDGDDGDGDDGDDASVATDEDIADEHDDTATREQTAAAVGAATDTAADTGTAAGTGGKTIDASAATAAAPTRDRPARFLGVQPLSDGLPERVLLQLDGQPEFALEQIDDPPRLVVDLRRTEKASRRSSFRVNGKAVRRVRLGEHGDTLRAVFDLNAPAGDYSATLTPEGVLVGVGLAGSNVEPTTTTSSSGGADAAAPAPTPTPAAHKAASTELSDVRFDADGAVARIELRVHASAVAEVDTRSPRAWVLKLAGATVERRLQRSLDATALDTAVRLLSTYQACDDPPVVHVVANLHHPAQQRLSREGDRLIWEITRNDDAAGSDALGSGAVSQAATAPQTAGFRASAQQLATSAVAETRSLTRRISIEVKDAEVINVIRLLAEVSGENIVASDEVTGRVTMKLKNVPWDQALDTILKTKGYDKVRQNNIWRIAPADVIFKEREVKAASLRAAEQVEKTVIKMVPVNYATAADILDQLTPMLSSRGTVKVDSRTNQIIVEDVVSKVDRIVELTQRLDKQTPQVLIQARIVEAQSNSLQELGVQWGGIGQATALQGTQTGLVFPNDITVAGAADDLQRNQTGGVTSPSRYAVNLPAPIGAGVGGGIGFVFGSSYGGQLLALRLTAMEENGTGRIVSSPRVTTLDNRTAKISQGIDIPISVVSAAGTNTRFIPAALELEVTPHVTNDGSVLMKVKTAKNEPDFSRTGAAGDPTIVRKSAETEVLVRDGDTTVIGGIYTRTTSSTYAEVPFFSKIPVFGWLFRKSRDEDKRAELLVFITPRIVNREAARLTGAMEALPAAGQEQPGEGGT